MQYSVIIFLFVVMWLLQFLFSIRQTKQYNQTINDMRRFDSGHLGVGMARSKFNIGPGTVTILVTSPEGIILDYREMSGISVFADFKKQEQWIGRKAEMIPLHSLAKTNKQAFLEALSFINSERQKGKLNQLVLQAAENN